MLDRGIDKCSYGTVINILNISFSEATKPNEHKFQFEHLLDEQMTALSRLHNKSGCHAHIM